MDKTTKAHFNHIAERLDDFANHLQYASDPLVEVQNGDKHQMLQSEAIADLWNRGYQTQSKVDELYHRTEILADIQKTIASYKDFKGRIKTLTKPVVIALAKLAAVFITAYTVYLFISGQITIYQLWKLIF